MDLDSPGSGAEITNATNAHSPLISPDGSRIVYAMASVTGTAYIRDIATGSAADTPAWGTGRFDPHWYDDGSDEYIISTTCSPETSQSSGYQTKKYNLSNDTETVLWASRAMDAGLTGDGRFLGEAYDYNYTVDFNTPGGVLDSWAWYGHTNESRTCNGSMSPDAGRNWRMLTLMIPHQFIRTYRYSATKARWAVVNKFGMPDPANQDEWQHPEWSNNPDFAIATAGKYLKPYDVYLVNTTTGASLKVLDYAGTAEADPTAEHPCLYIAKPTSYLAFQPAELVFYALEGDTDDLTASIVVSNWGTGGTLVLGTPTVVTGSWITNVTESSGTITVTVNPTGESSATGLIQITSAGAANSPRQATVHLHVLAPAADEDGDGDTNAAEVANGTDPLDEFSHYVAPSSDSSSGGCVPGATSGGLSLVLVLLGVAGAAKTKS